MSAIFRSLRSAKAPISRATRLNKRFASSGHHAGNQPWTLKGDLPWLAGSLVVFTPLTIYAINLIRSSPDHHTDASHAHHEGSDAEHAHDKNKTQKEPKEEFKEDGDVKDLGEDTDEPSSIKQAGRLTHPDAEDKSTARAREQTKDEAGGQEAPDRGQSEDVVQEAAYEKSKGQSTEAREEILGEKEEEETPKKEEEETSKSEDEPSEKEVEESEEKALEFGIPTLAKHKEEEEEEASA